MLTLCIYCFSEDFKMNFSDITGKFKIAETEEDFSTLINSYLDRFPDIKILTSNNIIYIYTNYSLVSDKDTRANIVTNIYNTLNENFKEEELKDNFIIKFYLLVPNGESFLVNNFDKINENLGYINSSMEEKIVQSLDKFQDKEHKLEDNELDFNKEDSSLEKFSKSMSDFITYYYLEYTMSKSINKNIDDNIAEYQEGIVNSIASSRKEEDGDEIRTELDLVNKIMVENDINMNNSQVLSCKYNGEDISIDDITSKLYSHTFPQYITQINIQDTLDDEYEIVTSKGTIHRAKGGKISILN